MSERSRPRTTVLRTVVVVVAVCVVAAALALAPRALSTPGDAISLLSSAAGRGVTTAVTVLLLIGAGVLSWRPAREDVTALLLERWQRLELHEAPAPAPADPADGAEGPVEPDGSPVTAPAAPSAAALAPHPS